MVIPGAWRGKPLTISIKPNCITLSVDDPSRADVYSFDLQGRMWTAFKDGLAYRRGLDGKILARWRKPGEERERRWLAAEEAQTLESQAQQAVAALYSAITSGEATLNRPLPDMGHSAIQQAINFDSAADAQQYHQVYQPVGILPPDQYMAVVLQATEGCSFNTCTFCTFYKDRPFRIKSPDDFRTHARAVRDFLGEGLSLRRTIFLGDANALVVPMHKLMPLLDIVHEEYDVDSLGGIYAFLDGFSGEKKSAADYAELKARGVERVYIGMESGSARLLRLLKKPGEPEDVLHAVQALKAGGIAVGVIILIGAGGETYAEQHVRETTDLLNAMALDMDDILYFSDLILSDEMPYARDAANLTPLTHAGMRQQQQAIESALNFTLDRGTPHISRYDIREFIY